MPTAVLFILALEGIEERPQVQTRPYRWSDKSSRELECYNSSVGHLEQLLRSVVIIM